MKKIGVLILFSLLLLGFVYAVEENASKNESIQIIKPAEIADKSNEVLAKEIVIPENLKFISKVIFGYNTNGEIDFQTFVVLICLLIFFVLVLHSILDSTPFFEGNKSWLGAIGVTIIISITGVLKSVSVFFFDLGNIFGILEKWSALKLGATVVIIIMIFYGLNIILGIIRETMILGKSVSEGIQAGAQMAKLNAMAEIEKNLK